MIPLTVMPESVGPMLFLGYTQSMKTLNKALRCGPISIEMNPEDVLFYDCRLLRRGKANDL